MKNALSTSVICTLFGALMLQPIKAQPTTLDTLFGDGGTLISPNTSTAPVNFQDTYGIVEMSNGYYLGLGNRGVNPGVFEIRMTFMKYDICGVPDSTFGVDGLSTIIYDNSVFLEVFSAQELSDGKILCVGKISNTGAVSTMRPALIRLMPDGTLDNSYGTDGVMIIQVQTPAISSGNFGNIIKIPGDTLIASIGRYPNINGGQSGVGLMRILPDGTPDAAFGTGGVLVYNFPDMGYSQAIWDRVHLVNDSTYWLTRAESHDLGATYHPVIYAFDTSGTVLTDFGTNGRLQDPTLVSSTFGRTVESAVDPEGRLLIAVAQAGFEEGVWVYRMVFMRYLPDGTPDTNFGEDGYTSILSNIPNTQNQWTSTLGVKADGGIWATFVHGLGTGARATSMVQLDPDGIPVPGIQIQIPQEDLGITALIQIDEDRWLAQGFGNGVVKHQSQLRFSENPIELPVITFSGNGLHASGSGVSYQWYLGGEAISGATDAVHTPAATGSYTVEMTDVVGCTHSSDVFEFTTLGVSDNQNAYLQIINNPVQEALFVYNDRENLPYEIINISGQRLASGQISHGMNTIHVSNLAKGLYLLRILDDENPAVQRFVKQ